MGIGAQRSGTTWFTDLVTRHPEVGLARNGRKEQHFFDDAHARAWSADRAERYTRRFHRTPWAAPGEFSPSYLRQPWVAALLAQCGEPPPLLVVLLRDPIERFRSAQRLYVSRSDFGSATGNRSRQMGRLNAAIGQWAGMYATQLDLWAQEIPADRFLVAQYEVMVHDPAAVVGEFWKRLGVAPIPLGDTSEPSRTTTSPEDGLPLDRVPAMLDSLHRLYEPEVDRLEQRWGIDRSLWPNFAV